MKSLRLAATATLIACVMPLTAAAVTLDASLDSWLRDDGATIAGRDGDLISAWSFFEGRGGSAVLERWGVIQFDLSSLTGTTVESLHLGLWSESFGSSDDFTPIVQTAAIVSPTGDFTAYDWAALTALQRTPLETLGAYDLGPVASNPQLDERYLFTPGSTADISHVQSIVNGGGTLSIVLIAAEGEDYRKSWGDGVYGGLAPILYVNELPPEQVDLTLQINTVTGNARIYNPGVTTVFNIDGYTIQSAEGSLVPDQWTSLAGSGSLVGWQEVAPSANALSELNLENSLEILGGVSFNLGNIFTPGSAEDIDFDFNATGVGPRFGVIEYVTDSGALDGDFNMDGAVDGNDFLAWQASSDPSADRLALWKANYGRTSAEANGLASAQAVPEPAAFAMFGVAAVGAFATNRRRWGRGRRGDVR